MLNRWSKPDYRWVKLSTHGDSLGLQWSPITSLPSGSIIVAPCSLLSDHCGSQSTIWKMINKVLKWYKVKAHFRIVYQKIEREFQSICQSFSCHRRPTSDTDTKYIKLLSKNVYCGSRPQSLVFDKWLYEICSSYRWYCAKKQYTRG